jgi:multisubunit Na+/H+ antiporter MnhE subunit
MHRQWRYFLVLAWTKNESTPIDVRMVILVAHEPLFRDGIIVSNVGVYASVIQKKEQTIHPGIGCLEMESGAPF